MPVDCANPYPGVQGIQQPTSTRARRESPMTSDKCQRCNGKGKRNLFGQPYAWCGGTRTFQPGPRPTCKGRGKVRAATATFDSQEGSGISFGSHKTVVGLDGTTACTKCDGTGAGINRPHRSMGNKQPHPVRTAFHQPIRAHNKGWEAAPSGTPSRASRT